MRKIDSWLEEYSESHQNTINKMLHWFCVPAIVLSILCLLWTVPCPAIFQSFPFLFNWAIVLMVLVTIYYIRLSKTLALGMIVVNIMIAVVIYDLNQKFESLWMIAICIFVIAWIGQFIGHRLRRSGRNRRPGMQGEGFQCERRGIRILSREVTTAQR